MPTERQVLSGNVTLVTNSTAPPSSTPDTCFTGSTGTSSPSGKDYGQTRAALLMHGVYLPWTVDTYLAELTLAVLLNEGCGQVFNGLSHYYHFIAEDVLGALKAYASIEPGLEQPQRVLVPWDVGWRDVWELNEVIVAGLFNERKSLFPSRMAIAMLNEGCAEGSVRREVNAVSPLTYAAAVDQTQWDRLAGDDQWVWFERG